MREGFSKKEVCHKFMFSGSLKFTDGRKTYHPRHIGIGVEKVAGQRPIPTPIATPTPIDMLVLTFYESVKFTRVLDLRVMEGKRDESVWGMNLAALNSSMNC